jgi:hypothetical protein
MEIAGWLYDLHTWNPECLLFDLSFAKNSTYTLSDPKKLWMSNFAKQTSCFLLVNLHTLWWRPADPTLTRTPPSPVNIPSFWNASLIQIQILNENTSSRTKSFHKKSTYCIGCIKNIGAKKNKWTCRLGWAHIIYAILISTGRTESSTWAARLVLRTDPTKAAQQTRHNPVPITRPPPPPARPPSTIHC